MKMHLGCGKRKIAGWTNIDVDQENKPDIVADCLCKFFWSLSDHYEPIEAIYACHVLEHCGRHEYKAVLKRWHDLLKPGGILRLSVPDIKAVFGQYWKTESLDGLLGFLYGGQRNEHDHHKMGWDEVTLRRDLLEAGFKDVRRYDRDKTEHADVDDYSASYLPKLSECKSMEEYRKGTLMSLNVEATKG